MVLLKEKAICMNKLLIFLFFNIKITLHKITKLLLWIEKYIYFATSNKLTENIQYSVAHIQQLNNYKPWFSLSQWIMGFLPRDMDAMSQYQMPEGKHSSGIITSVPCRRNTGNNLPKQSKKKKKKKDTSLRADNNLIIMFLLIWYPVCKVEVYAYSWARNT